METQLLKRYFSNEKGVTLIEIIISLAILMIIIIPFLTMFTHSTVTNSRSETMLDATFVAQRVMEDIYKDSQDETKPIPVNGSKTYWDSWGSNYWIHQEITVQNNLVRVIIKVYSNDSQEELEAQMETYMFWK